MRFYTNQHPFYCGIDLHARSMYVCVLSHNGEILLHRNMQAAPEPFLKAVAPYHEGLVVAVACLFTWYGLADLCAAQDIPCVLGHTLSMKAMHGGKAKNDKIISHKIAALLRGDMLPQTYVSLAGMRATRALLRRRTHLMRKRSELLSHVHNTNSLYNLPEIGTEIGNAQLKWAFSEAAVLFLRNNEPGQKLLARVEKKHGKGKALSILAHTLGRAVYDMLKRKTAFDMDLFLRSEGSRAGEPEA